MKLVILLFPALDKLVRFRMAVDPKVYEADLEMNTLFCFCNEDQVELANYVYGASCLEIHTALN
jgi:hypothetical protein